ncbi:hypothetical protein [Ohtaekwangia sp.]
MSEAIMDASPEGGEKEKQHHHPQKKKINVLRPVAGNCTGRNRK